MHCGCHHAQLSMIAFRPGAHTLKAFDFLMHACCQELVEDQDIQACFQWQQAVYAASVQAIALAQAAGIGANLLTKALAAQLPQQVTLQQPHTSCQC